MKRFIILVILLCALLCSCAHESEQSETSDPFSETPIESVDIAYLLEATDIRRLVDQYEEVTFKCDGEEYRFYKNRELLTLNDGKDILIGSMAERIFDSVLPKVFEKETELQLETNLLPDNTSEAVVYLFIDETVQAAFESEQLEENGVFSVYYEFDESGRAVSVTYSKAVDVEDFEILRTVMIEYD